MAIDRDSAWFMYNDQVGRTASVVTTNDVNDATNNSPVEYIKDRHIYRQWQSPTNSNWFQVDFGSDQVIQALVVTFPRTTDPDRFSDKADFAVNDTIRHYLDEDGGTAGSGAIFDSGALSSYVDPRRGYHVVVLDTPVSARYWRCQLTATSRAAENYFLVAMAMAGQVFQPQYNHTVNDSFSFTDPSEIQRTPASQSVFSQRNDRILEARLVYDFIQDAQRSSWETLSLYSGRSEPVLFAQMESNSGANDFTASAGPNGHIWEGDKAFVGIVQDNLSLIRRAHNTSVRQLQITEHR